MRLQSADRRCGAAYPHTPPDKDTLYAALAAGPLPLALALSYASDVAGALRELHYDGRAHGWVHATVISVDSGRAVLRAGNASRQADPRGDVFDFGALLFELINGRKTGPSVPLPVVPRTMPRTGADGIRLAVDRLASRCLSDESPDIQKVATEVRLLKVLAQQLPDATTQFQPQPVELPVSPAQRAVREEAAAAPEETDRAAGSEDDPVYESNSHGPHCPHCGSTYVFRSRPRSAMEELLLAIGSPVHRCHHCYHRFFTFFGLHFNKMRPVDKLMRRGC